MNDSDASRASRARRATRQPGRHGEAVAAGRPIGESQAVGSHEEPRADARADARAGANRHGDAEIARRAAEVAALADQPDPGLTREFVSFLMTNKKWWMAPLLGSILLLGWLSWLSAGTAGPFIYTLF